MAEARHMLRTMTRWVSGGAVSALVVCGAALVLLRTEGDSGVSVMARPRDAVIVTRPHQLTSILGLTINEGVIHGPDASRWADPAPLSKLEIDNAVFAMDLVPKPFAGDGSRGPVTDLDRVLAHLGRLNVATLLVKRSQIDLDRGDGVPLHLTDVTAEITASRGETYQAKGSARYRGTLVNFEASWSRPTDPKAATTYPVRLSVGGRVIEARLDGKLDLGGMPSFEGRGDFKSPKVRVLARWLGLPVDSGHDLRKGAISGDLTWRNGTLAFANAAIGLDGNEGTGVVALALTSPRPRLDGTIAFKTFQIDRYLETLLGGALPGSEQLKPLLSLVDADLRLSAAKVKAPRLEFGRAALTLSVKDGRLHTDIAEIEVEGGTASGQITLEGMAQERRLGMKLRGRQVDPGRALTDWMKRNPLLGRVNVAFEGTGSGPSVVDSVRNLAGRGTIELVDGGRLGLDLKALAHVAKTETATGWAAAGRGVTVLSTLDARFQVSAGAVQMETITAKSGSETILGTGRVDILNRLIDLSVSLGQSAGSGEVPVSNRDVLRLHGPWGDPAIGLHQAAPVITKGPTLKGAVLETSPQMQRKVVSPASAEASYYGTSAP